MNLLLPFFSCLLLLLTLSKFAVGAVDIYSIERDLAEFNKTCSQETCESRYSFLQSLSYRSCHCGIQCVQLGTCCIDSYYANVPHSQLKPACLPTYNKPEAHFMLDQCANDSAWASLCSDEWSGEDDVQKLVPVTSLLTSITYKNYYCLRCHEVTDEFLYWDVLIESNFVPSEEESKQSHSNISLTYNKDMETWMAIYGENIGYFPVNLTVLDPVKLYKLAHICVRNLITDCPNEWFDEEVRNKCQSYMAIKEVSGINDSIKYYKNIHCALCNFESLNDVSCKKKPSPSGRCTAVPITFTHLFDINRSDGDLLCKVKKCVDDDIWDPFTKKCRKHTCALPGFKIKNRKCVEE